MKKTVYHFVLVLITIAFSACKSDHVRKDMIQFDRAFIPVFYYTTIGDLKSAETAMYPLKAKWQHYQSLHHLKDKTSEDWKETIRLMGDWLEDASCALEERNAYRALVQLDHARYELVDLRLRANMDDYYLDYLWDFETSMYMVIDVANDQMIDLLEFNEFERLTEEVVKAWTDVLERPIDDGLFHCTSDQMRYVNYQKERLGMSVESLLEAVETADRCQFAEASLAMEPAYLNYLAMFGDFEGAETFYALKK